MSGGKKIKFEIAINDFIVGDGVLRNDIKNNICAR